MMTARLPDPFPHIDRLPQPRTRQQRAADAWHRITTAAVTAVRMARKRAGL